MSRRSQPYRKTRGRAPSPVLAKMQKGRDAFGHNPMDAKRRAMKLAGRRHKRARVRRRY